MCPLQSGGTGRYEGRPQTGGATALDSDADSLTDEFTDDAHYGEVSD